MKRITKLFCCLILLTLSIIGLSSCNKNNNQEIALTRTGKIISYGDEYFVGRINKTYICAYFVSK